MTFTQKIRENKAKGRISGSLLITIPSPIVECYDIREGDLVVFDVVKVIKK